MKDDQAAAALHAIPQAARHTVFTATVLSTCCKWNADTVALLQVDLIICFDSDASPIRNIQRMGRTGRHKAGRVVYIMSEGKEEESYKKGLQVSQQHSTSCIIR